MISDNTVERLRSELRDLAERGANLYALLLEDREADWPDHYQVWYTQALPVVRLLLPDRFEEFEEYYWKKDRTQLTYSTYTIRDFCLGTPVPTAPASMKPTFSADTVARAKFRMQLAILEAAESRLNSQLHDLQGVIQAELFDSQLDAADELLQAGHYRAAGAVAGVVLEKHLRQLCRAHNVAVKKKNPTIGDLNEALKAAKVYPTKVWRFISYLADVRNSSVHVREDGEPKAEEVKELIDGTRRIIKQVG